MDQPIGGAHLASKVTAPAEPAAAEEETEEWKIDDVVSCPGTPHKTYPLPPGLVWRPHTPMCHWIVKAQGAGEDEEHGAQPGSSTEQRARRPVPPAQRQTMLDLLTNDSAPAQDEQPELAAKVTTLVR